jgi:hypothetical protein
MINLRSCVVTPTMIGMRTNFEYPYVDVAINIVEPILFPYGPGFSEFYHFQFGPFLAPS